MIVTVVQKNNDCYSEKDKEKEEMSIYQSIND